jgi:hypothetical protein
MNTKRVIRKVISEAAGISFEVRKWAKIIEDYVDKYIAAEKEKLKAQQPQQQKPSTPQKGIGSKPYYSWDFEKESEEDEFLTEFTHFETHGGNMYDSAKVYGYDLYINADILDEYPNIKSIVQDKLFEVDLNGDGTFDVDTVDSKFPDNYLYAILEIINDRMVMGESFYTDNYEEVFAAVDEETVGNYYNYMNEDDRWGRYGGYGSYGGYGGYSYTPQPKIEKIEINGKDFPEAYEDFKVDKWIITNSGRIEYDHWKSGYNEEGEYVVYLNMPMSSIGGSALVHEIKHAYDDWNRMSKGAPPIRAGWEIKNIYTPDFEKLVLGGSYKLSPMLHPIIRYYYLGSKLESPAYLENEYDNASMMGSYRDTAKKMMDFKASNFLTKKGEPAKGLQESWTKLITEYDIPFFRKFKNVVDFLNYTEKHFNKRGRDILRRIDKMRYVHNRPQPKYEPKVYTKPVQSQTQTVKPNTPKTTGQTEIDRLNSQIDKLESEWDKMYEDYHKSPTPEKRKDLSELDEIINGLIDKVNKLMGDNLPF